MSEKQNQDGLTWTNTSSRLSAETFGQPALEIEMDCHVGVLKDGRWIKTPVRALWDTGTSITVITPEVANKLPLEKYDRKINLNGLMGRSDADLYFAHVILPNGKASWPMLVAVNDLPNVDMLLGMNFILGGRLTIERKADGGTRFTFDLGI